MIISYSTLFFHEVKMAARHRPFRESKVEKDRREAKEREEDFLPEKPPMNF